MIPGYAYRLLTDGEQIRETDEFYNAACDEWTATNRIGNQLSTRKYRRKIDPGPGFELVAEGAPIQAGDQFIAAMNGPDPIWDRCQTSVGKFNLWGEFCPGPLMLIPWATRRPKAQPAATPAGREHWIICRQDPDFHRYKAAQFPFVHATEATAIAEAQRLASEHGGKFVVFRAVAAFEKVKTTPEIEATAREINKLQREIEALHQREIDLGQRIALTPPAPVAI